MERRLGIYIHIPFCIRKCAYCDFYSITQMELREAYVDALIEQLETFRLSARHHIVDSIYLGGGTPSLLSGEDMKKLMAAVRDIFHVAPDAEISMEANPGTLDGEKLAAYKEAGINRLSIGLQSAHDDELKSLSRIHTRRDFENSFLLARLEGFDNINVDIMYALPGQTEEKLAETISYVVSLQPEHVSFYGLKVEPETPFGRDTFIQKRLPDEDAQYYMYLSSTGTLESAGLHQYEISNFSKEGKECRHNMKYWKCDDYLSFGPAAYSFFDGKMFSYAKDILRFLASPTDSEALLDELFVPTNEELATQYVMVGFRLRDGIDVGDYNARFRDDFEARYGERIAPFLESDHMLRTEKGYCLSRQGMLISNYILSEILEF